MDIYFGVDQACRADDLAICGGWTDWYLFSVDRVAPHPPLVSSGDFDVTGNTRKGLEFVPGKLTFAPNSDNDIYAYAYSSSGGTPALTTSQCATQLGDVTVVCASAPSSTLIPLATVNPENVYAFDKAGNISGSTTATINVYGTSAGAPSHAWRTTTANQNPVADYLSAAPQLPLSLTGATWATGTGLRNHDTALSLAGSSAFAATDPALGTPLTADSTHSFTVAVWVRANGTGANYGSSYHTVLAQDSYHSSFYLQEAITGHWRFCMPASLTGTLSLDCATSTNPANTSGNVWTLLVGVWDAPSQKLRLHIEEYDNTGWSVVGGDDDVSADHTTIAAASTAALVVGRARSYGNPTDWWVGEIADPLVYNQILDKTQIGAFDDNMPNLDGQHP